jgi:carbonic anhydrase
MSIFSNQSTWPPQCLSANQSPINLSQTSSKPCEVTCDLVMDDGYISQAIVLISDEALLLVSYSSLGSCKFRGESYICKSISINHPSHHTLEGVQADGEVIAYFEKPTGELLCVSSLFRVNPSQTSSYTFFKQFVPYALPTGETQVKLQDWSVAMMVPPSSSYYTYTGSTCFPPCAPCEWVVFKTMINMDIGDFAYLVRNSQAGSRSLSAQGSREVYFNDTQNLSGVMPNDGKIYLRLRPTGNTPMPSLSQTGQKSKKDIKLKPEPEDPNKPVSWTGKRQKELNDHIKSNGGYLPTAEIWLIAIAVIAGCYYGYNYSRTSPFSTEFIKPASSWTRDTFGFLWDFLMSIPGIIYNWTIGWITFLSKPKTRDGKVLSMQGAIPGKIVSAGPAPAPAPQFAAT